MRSIDHGTAPTDDRAGQRRTFALIPGAGGAAWYWHRVVRLLQEAGHEAIAVDLPGDDPTSGLPEYARQVVSAIDIATTWCLSPCRLVGSLRRWSRRGSCRALVFVNAMIPLSGETPGLGGTLPAGSEARAAAAEWGATARFDLDVYFLHDVPPEIAAAGRAVPAARGRRGVQFGVRFRRWPSVPIPAVAGADDRFFPIGSSRRSRGIDSASRRTY